MSTDPRVVAVDHALMRTGSLPLDTGERRFAAEVSVAALDAYDEEHIDLAAYVDWKRTEKALREQIARDIEARCRRENHAPWSPLCSNCIVAARIARGGAS